MKRKDFVLRDTEELKQAEFGELKMKERNWVKEGMCEECGGFDILSKHNGIFLCGECLALINSNNKTKKKNQKKTKK